MRLYKLTTQDNMTQNNTLWGPGVTHAAKESGGGLCSGSWIHAYSHPLVAIIMNPNHANIKNPKLWLASGNPGCHDGQLKLGCKTLTTVRELSLPKISTEHLVVFAIDLSLRVFDDIGFALWANAWKSGTDRSCAAARAARAAAYASADSTRAARAAEYAARAAEYATYAAYAATCATYAATDAAYSAAHAAAYAAEYAAYAATNAAHAANAADAATDFDLIKTLETTARKIGITWDME